MKLLRSALRFALILTILLATGCANFLSKSTSSSAPEASETGSDNQENDIEYADFSIEPDELTMLVNESANVQQAIGHIVYGGAESEQKSKKYRRSIYVSKDIKCGEKLSLDNLKVVRPGFGLAPKYLEQVLGQSVTSDLTFGEPLTWDALKYE